MVPGNNRSVWTAAGFAAGLAVATAAALLVWSVDFFSGGPRIDTSRPSVVRQIQQLQRLETVVYAMDKIVSGGYESKYLPRFLAGDRILLIVYGDVTAGVDLSRIEADSVRIEDRSVTLTLPAAEIFSTRIDNERTRVYSRETGLFSAVDPALETEVRKEAERQIRQAALDSGVLQAAIVNARHTLEAFLRGLGFERVEIDPE
jgi:hypothetical protein